MLIKESIDKQIRHLRIGIFGNKYQKHRNEQIKRVFDRLSGLGAEIWIEEDFHNYLNTQLNYYPSFKDHIRNEHFDVDIALSLGGDGTFLRTTALVGKKKIPILGINAGSLGFLADIFDEDIENTLEEVFRKEYSIEERSLLELKCDDPSVQEVFSGFNYALNEIAILRRTISSMITIHTYLNDDYLTSYWADGLIIATPTGSTAYSMSVNGPIIVPSAQSLVLSPVAPHSLTVRPLVIPDNYKISLKIDSRSQDFRVAIDGNSYCFPTGISLSVHKADFSIQVIKRYKQTFYETLRKKLMWGSDNRNV
jgi:NAD+ kinase